MSHSSGADESISADQGKNSAHEFGHALDQADQEFISRYMSIDSELTWGSVPDEDSLADQTTIGSSNYRDEQLRNEIGTHDQQRALGEFKLIGKVGSGGFGVVYRALDTRLDRDVAIKVIKPDRIGDPRRCESFQAEARAMAQLRHPNIVPVHQAGAVSSGQTFIVYEFIDGPTLRGFMRMNGVFSPEKAVNLLTEIADGLGYAHRSGIVHRDIKPSNILIEAETGEPHIADFGCASRQSMPATEITDASDVFIGTPQYFSPEQAAGKSHLADARSDVWALGVVMDEMLTGRRTFRTQEESAETITDLLKSIQQVRPTALEERCEHIDRDLNAIWEKCLAADPKDRYANGAELAEDLRRWTRNDELAARPLQPLEKVARWAKKNPLVATSLVTVFATIFVASLINYFSLKRIQRENFEKVRYAVELLVENEPDDLVATLEQLQSPGYRRVSQRIIGEELQSALKTSSDTQLMTDRAWRLSLGFLGLVELETKSDQLAGNSMLRTQALAAVPENLAKKEMSPDEFEVACQIVSKSQKDSVRLSDALGNITGDIKRPASQRLRGLLATKLVNNGDLAVNEENTSLATRLLYDFASKDWEQADDWIGLFARQIPWHHQSLLELRRQFERKSDRQLIDRLIVAISREPDDLIRQLLYSDRPLAGVLPILKEQLDESNRQYDFQSFVAHVAGPLSTEMLAKLWLAYLYVADFELNFNDINEQLLRLKDPGDRSAETTFVCESFRSGIPRSQLLKVAKRWHPMNDPRLSSILVALGAYPQPANLDNSDRDLLLSIWKSNPHAGVHGACDWLLRKWQIEHDIQDLPSEYEELSGDQPPRNWRTMYGMTFVKINKPLKPFQVGTPVEQLQGFDRDLRDPEFSGYEVEHAQQIAGDFEMATCEVTVQMFEQFLEARESANHLNRAYERIRQNPSKLRLSEKQIEDLPADGISWYDAIEYCVWLSEQHGFESCYDVANDPAAFAEMISAQITPDCDRSRNGYRLPSNGEWEYACRAGSRTLWPFGDMDTYLIEYAACSKGGSDMLPIGSLRPNAWGLFDLLGNAAEMTDSPSRSNARGSLVTDSAKRVETKLLTFDVRGGAYYQSPFFVRSARRVGSDVYTDSYGFPGYWGKGLRLVRTLENGRGTLQTKSD